MKYSEEAFLSEVEFEPMSGCWIWMGARQTSGYGNCHFPGRRRRTYLVHRVSYEMFVGSIPAGQCVLHKCDLRCCVNPTHLWLGTRGDNNRDTKAKGRSPIGERNGQAKLTAASVLAMRNLRASGATLISLSRLFGVSLAGTSRICSGHHWSHI